MPLDTVAIFSAANQIHRTRARTPLDSFRALETILLHAAYAQGALKPSSWTRGQHTTASSPRRGADVTAPYVQAGLAAALNLTEQPLEPWSIVHGWAADLNSGRALIVTDLHESASGETRVLALTVEAGDLEWWGWSKYRAWSPPSPAWRLRGPTLRQLRRTWPHMTAARLRIG